jgi:glycerate kinase
MDSQGQVAFGDGRNFLKYYKDQNGEYRLEISAASVRLSTTNKTIEETVDDAVSGIGVGARNLIRNSANLIFDNYYFSGTLIATDNGAGKVIISCGASATHDGNSGVIIRTSAAVNNGDDGNVTITSR